MRSPRSSSSAAMSGTRTGSGSLRSSASWRSSARQRTPSARSSGQGIPQSPSATLSACALCSPTTTIGSIQARCGESPPPKFPGSRATSAPADDPRTPAANHPPMTTAIILAEQSCRFRAAGSCADPASGRAQTSQFCPAMRSILIDAAPACRRVTRCWVGLRPGCPRPGGRKMAGTALSEWLGAGMLDRLIRPTASRHSHAYPNTSMRSWTSGVLVTGSWVRLPPPGRVSLICQVAGAPAGVISTAAFAASRWPRWRPP
jgi:hypothetical protein